MNGSIWDLDRPLEGDATLAILTERDPDALEVLRHSAAHILATAVRELFPSAGIGFGPPIEDGFYYDFEVRRPFTPEDLDAIEAKMAKVAARELSVRPRGGGPRRSQPRFADDPLKLERIAELGDDEIISTYTDGPFIDLCRGPARARHRRGSSTSSCSHAAGAYWRGDEKRQMLQRIYGTAFFKKEELDALSAPASRRRRSATTGGSGKRARPVHVPPVRAGRRVLDRARHDRSTTLLSDYMRERAARAATTRSRRRCCTTRGCGRSSGHWGKYRENMFLVLDNETGEHDFSLKPMNCPSHHLYYRLEEAPLPRAAAALRTRSTCCTATR